MKRLACAILSIILTVQPALAVTIANLKGTRVIEIQTRGPQGPPGATQYRPKGPWSSTTPYTPNDQVVYNGTSYVALLPNTDSVPVEGATWTVLAAKGETGQPGPKGEQGLQGERGLIGPAGYTPVKGVDYTDGALGTSDYNQLQNRPNLGTAAVKDAPASGDAAVDQVVIGNDTRLTDPRTPTGHTQPFSTITGTPTTLAGYGITDALQPTGSAAQLTGFPTLNQDTTGTASGLTAQYIDWSLTSGGASIKNKPTTLAGYGIADATDKPTFAFYTSVDRPTKAEMAATYAPKATTLAGYGITDALQPTGSAAQLTGFPTLNQNTTGTAAGLTAQYIDWSLTNGGASIKNKPIFGTVAVKDVPASGDAAVDQVVMGNDTRLTDPRTPTGHTQPFSTITGTPTTLAGYGIADATDKPTFATYTSVDRETVSHAAATYAAKSSIGVTGGVASYDDARILAGGTALQPTGSGAGLTGLTYAQTGKSADYTVAPYGAPWKADYYCTATDCSAAFISAITAAKTAMAGATGAKIKCLSGLYPFTQTVAVNDVDSVTIEGNAPMGMWGTGGTIFSQNANVEMFNFGRTNLTPRAITFTGIHFKNNGSYNKAMIHTVNAHNVHIEKNYFELANPAIIAERPWDWWLTENNFRDCGTGNTATTACVVMATATVASDGGAVGDNGSGWHSRDNRFERRTGTSYYIQQSSNYPMNIAKFNGEKWEGVAGQAYPAIYGWLADSQVTGGSSCFYADINCLFLSGYNNTVSGNFFSGSTGSDILISGTSNTVQGNTFNAPITGNPAHISIMSGAVGSLVKNNLKLDGDTIPLMLDNGTGTVTDSVIVTSVGSPGSDANIATEKATRSAISAAVGAMGGGNVTGPGSAVDGHLAVFSGTDGKTIADGGAIPTPTILTDSASLAATISDETGSGKVVFSDTPAFTGAVTVNTTLGPNLTTNGTFDTDVSGWGATNWSWVSGTNKHDPGATTGTHLFALTPAAIGNVYKITYDVVNRTAGSVNSSFGGVPGQAVTSNTTGIVDYITVTNTTGDLVFGPTADFDGAIDNVRVQLLSGGTLAAGNNAGFTVDSLGANASLSNSGPTSWTMTAAHNSGTTSNNFNFRKSRGSLAAPSATQSGDVLLAINGYGYGTSSWWASNSGYIQMLAAEAFTGSAKGSYWDFATVAAGGSTRSVKARIWSTGGISINPVTANHADPGAGSLIISGTFIAGYTAVTDTSATISTDTTRLTVTSTTARTLTLPATLKKGTSTANLTVVASGAAASVTFAAETGGTISWGDAGAPATTGTVASGKRQRYTCVSENAAETTAAAWDCYLAGGTF